MITDGDYTYCGDHFVTYIIVESLCYIPATNTGLCVNYTLIKNLAALISLNVFIAFYPIIPVNTFSVIFAIIGNTAIKTLKHKPWPIYVTIPVHYSYGMELMGQK